RAIDAAHDGGGWVFETSGDIQPYEKPEMYVARRVRDRFTPDLLEEYCRALGIRLFDEHFYGPKGILIAPRTLPRVYAADGALQTVRAYILREARQDLGLESE